MAFEDVARRMAGGHDAAVPASSAAATPETTGEVETPSGLKTGLLIAAGMLIALASGLIGLFLADDRLMRRLAICGVVLGIALVIHAMRRD